MRWRSAIVAAALVSLCSCVAQPAGTYEPAAVSTASRIDPDDLTLRADQVDRDVREATVRVRARGCFGLGTGSGVVIGRHLLATNRHVVAGADELQVSTWDGHTLDVAISGYADHNDLALVETRQPLQESLRVGPTPANGKSVDAVGYPKGRRLTFSPGEVVDRVDGSLFGEATDTLRITNTIHPGNSGGPLVDEDGNVVGVVFAVERSTGYGLAVPVDALTHAIKQRGFFENPSPC